MIACYHEGKSPRGPIFNVLWLKEGEKLEECESNYLIKMSSKSSSLRVVNYPLVKDPAVANYSCAVVYANGSMEESEPVTVRIKSRFSNLYIITCEL